jgi:ribonuclease G
VRQKIIINSTPYESRVALLEHETLVEIHIERTQQRNIAGNIYTGRVTRVLPGMQAAFVDIGLEKAGFIHASDLFGGPLPAGYADDEIDELDDPTGETAISDSVAEDAEDAEDPNEEYEPADYDDLDISDIPDEADEFDGLLNGEEDGEDDLQDIEDVEDLEVEAEEDDSPEASNTERPARSFSNGRGRGRRSSGPMLPLEDKIKKNQEILVQVAKESIGTKGPRLTSHISMPGRHLVYTPTATHIGVSRRIADPKERKRLRETVASMKAEGGFIVRTACEGLPKKEIQDDMKFLLKLWSSLSKKREENSAPVLLHEDMDVILRIIRDLLTSDVDEVIVDNERDYERLKAFTTDFMPRSTSRIKLHNQPEPIFDHYNIEPQISKALERRVYLKSGGHIVVDQTEALTAIDVNTGRFVGKHDQEETMLRTNLEATKVVVEQLRLRNLGGMIIIDFIDMERAVNRNKVTETMRAALRKDKTRSNMRKISELGLVQMTRKRTRESLKHQLCDPCSYCAGNGVLRSAQTIAYTILRQLHKAARLHATASTLMIKAHPEVITFLYDEESDQIDGQERALHKHFFLRATPGMHLEDFDISPVGPAPDRLPAARPSASRTNTPRTNTPRTNAAPKDAKPPKDAEQEPPKRKPAAARSRRRSSPSTGTRSDTKVSPT